MTNHKVDSILLDAYSASSIRKNIDIEEIHPVKLVEYPRFYGVVLSGQTKFITKTLQDNVRLIENDILRMIATNTQKMKVYIFRSCIM